MVDLLEKKSALIVDDSQAHRGYLKALLKEENYKVYTAENGAVGVNMYQKYQPDIVLMDINMPVMNGFEAAKIIKKNCTNGFSPLIFVTTLDSEEMVLESAQAGGDGILIRPFSADVFKAKVMSLQRISDLYHQVNILQETQQHDAELAEQLMASVIDTRNYLPTNISIVKQAASLFSGDIQLSELCPNGDINILLGDFTGHGLRSSVGAIPVSETFRSMTKKGFSLLEIASQINHQLYELLPSDLFLAAGLMTISFHDKSIYAINAGIPDIFHISKSGSIKHKISSSHPPLGIIDKLSSTTLVEVYSTHETDQLLLISDGVIEARNSLGEFYGVERVCSAIKLNKNKTGFAAYLLDEVNRFGTGVEQSDDISIISVSCNPLFSHKQCVTEYTADNIKELNHHKNSDKPQWSWQLKLNDQKLASVNPVPLAMNQLKDLEDESEHWQSVYTILTELYVNAIDHGILALDSSLKESAEGFSQYFKLRAHKLSQPINGSISISIDLYKFASGGKVLIKVSDSGEGFDVENEFKKRINKESHLADLSGRGIELVSKLCETLFFHDNGTSVEASYLWE